MHGWAGLGCNLLRPGKNIPPERQTLEKKFSNLFWKWQERRPTNNRPTGITELSQLLSWNCKDKSFNSHSSPAPELADIRLIAKLLQMLRENRFLIIEERSSAAEKISLTLLTLLCSDQINLVCKDNLGQNCCYYWLLWLKLAERLVSARALAFVVICKTKLKIFPYNCAQSIILNIKLRNTKNQQTDC